jgi:hypothetical protein
MGKLQVFLAVGFVCLTLGIHGLQIWSSQEKLTAEEKKTKKAEADARAAEAHAKEEIDRIRKEQPAKIAKAIDDLAKLKIKLDEGRANVEAAEAKQKVSTRQTPIKLRFIAIAGAYTVAQIKLGRPPRELAELKPHMQHEQDLLTPKSGKPFGIAWNEDAMQSAKKPLVWEPEPDQDGGRWVMLSPLTAFHCAHLKESDFQKLQPYSVPVIPILPPPGVE